MNGKEVKVDKTSTPINIGPEVSHREQKINICALILATLLNSEPGGGDERFTEMIQISNSVQQSH